MLPIRPRAPYLWAMTSKRDSPPALARPEEVLGEANRLRLERDRSLSMSERLARMQELCKQLTAIGGAAKRQ